MSNPSNVKTSGMKQFKFDFVWSIQNFSRLVQKHLILPRFDGSPLFENSENKNLIIQPKLNIHTHQHTFFSVYVGWTTKNNILGIVDITVTMSNTVNQIFKQQKLSLLSTLNLRGDLIGWSEFVEKNFVLHNENCQLIDDCLNVQLNLKVFLKEIGGPKRYNAEAELANDFSLLFENDTHSDVTFTIGDKIIKAHKNILSARSSVFSAMFQHDMIENTTNSVIITDFDFDTMKEILRFIYTGKPKFLCNVKSLMAAAEKYNLQSLKKLCAAFLKREVNVDTCCDIFVNADLYGCSDLRRTALDFMLQNMDKLVNSSDFSELIYPNQEVMKEITLALFQTSSNNKLKRVHE